MRSLLSLFNRDKKNETSIVNDFSVNKPVKGTAAAFSESAVSNGFDWVKTGDDPRHLRNIFESDQSALKSIQKLFFHIEDQGEQARRIAFISSETGMEASAITVALGRKLAENGLRVAAIDMAINQPFLSKLVAPELPGLCEVLRGETNISSAIYGDDRSNLNLIPAGVKRMTLEAVFAHRDLQSMFEGITMAYDRILLDFGAMNTRFYADKIANIATMIVIIGKGDQKHLRLIEMYDRYKFDGKIDVAVMMADAGLDERLAA